MKQIKERLYTKTSLILLLIVLLAIALRFINTPGRYGFDKDPTRDAVVTTYAIQNHILPLSGPPSGIAPFSFGPWYYYQLIAADILLPGDFAPWIYLGLTSVAFVIIMFYLGKELKDEKAGLLFAFFAAVTPAITGPTAGLSNPNFIPLFASLFIYLTVRYMNKRAGMYLVFLWGAIFGIGLSHHYQMVLLILLPFAAVVLNRNNLLKNMGIFILGVIVVSIPTLIHQFQSNFDDLQGVVFYMTEGKNSVYIPNSWKIYILDFWIPYFSYFLGTSFILSVVVALVLLCGNILPFVQNKINKKYLLLMLVLFLDVFFLRYFSAQREYYYLLFAVPLLIIFVGYSLSTFFDSTKLKWVPLVVLVVMSPFILKQDVERLKTRADLKEYRALGTFLKYEYPNEKFVFYSCNERKVAKIYAINYFFMKEGLLDENGVKIGFASEGCKTMKSKSALKKAVPIPLQKAYDITELTQEEIDASGWEKITPEIIFQNTISRKNK